MPKKQHSINQAFWFYRLFKINKANSKPAPSQLPRPSPGVKHLTPGITQPAVTDIIPVEDVGDLTTTPPCHLTLRGRKVQNLPSLAPRECQDISALAYPKILIRMLPFNSHFLLFSIFFYKIHKPHYVFLKRFRSVSSSTLFGFNCGLNCTIAETLPKRFHAKTPHSVRLRGGLH